MVVKLDQNDIREPLLTSNMTHRLFYVTMYIYSNTLKDLIVYYIIVTV
jgi:hypothetical protein